MKSSVRFLLILILLVTQSGIFTQISFAQTAARQTISDANNLNARLATIEKAVEEKRRSLGIPGLSLAIVKDDKIIFSKGFGWRDVEKKLPVTPDTLFAIGSSSKAFTSMAAMMSADEGKLSLDDSPKKFLPYFKLRDAEADANVTLRDLMSHRTGLDRTDFSLQFSDSLTREDLIKVAGFAKPSARFRQKWQYQNTMFTAAGEVVARANNTSWEKLIPSKIFQPLGMKATDISIFDMQQSPDFSLGYDYNPETKQARNVKMVDLAPAAPAGAINSNARDMAQWLRLLLGVGVFDGKRLVSEKNFAELFAEQIQIAPKFGYGLGWFLRDWRGKKVVDHGGNIDGFSAEVAMIPEEKLGLVMLSNVTVSALQNEIREIVWANMLGAPEKNTEAKMPAPAANPPIKAVNNLNVSSELFPIYKEILGNYESERTGTPIDIAADNGATLFIIRGQPHKLTVKSKDVFAIEGFPEDYVLNVKRDENGKISNLVFNQRDVAAPLRRADVPADAPSVKELMKKVVEASGGEANWRKHSSILMETTIDLENEGMSGEAVVSAKAPNLSASNVKYFALGKEVGTSFDYFDGREGGSFSTSGKSIVGTPSKKSGKFLEDAKINADFYQPLDWKTQFQTVTIKRMSKIGDEAVYVVVKTPENGHPVTDYVSTKSFLVLRRDSAQGTGFGDSTVPYIENFSDYKTIDGVTLPFKIISGVNGANKNVTIVKSIKFNVDVPDSAFRPAFSANLSDDKTKNPATAFVNVAVLPMDQERVLENQTVVVRDGKISEIGAADKVKISKDAVKIDGRGKFLMPGLADMHAHLQAGAGTLDDAAGQQLQLFLVNGVTTVRNMIGKPEHLVLRDKINKGELIAPTIFTSGAPMVVNRISSPEAAVKDVTEQKTAGYDLIKIHEGLSPEIYAAIVETAKKVGIPVAGHVTATIGLERALTAKQTSIEHLDGYIQNIIADASPVKPTGSQVQIGEVLNYVDEKKIPAAIKATKDANVWNCPTLRLFQIIVSPQTSADLLKLPELQYVPLKVRDAFAKQKNPTADIPPEEGEKYTKLRFRLVREMQQAGAKLLVGSDPGQMFLVAGFGTHKELESFVEAGLTPYQALEAATKNPAEYLATFMKIPNDFGTIKAGNRADVLLLEANPLQSIANTNKIAGVMTRGRWISKDEIQKTLAAIAAKQKTAAQ